MTRFTSETAFSCTFHHTITPSRSACMNTSPCLSIPVCLLHACPERWTCIAPLYAGDSYNIQLSTEIVTSSPQEAGPDHSSTEIGADQLTKIMHSTNSTIAQAQSNAVNSSVISVTAAAAPSTLS